MMSIVYSRVRPSINIKDKVWQTVFVSDIFQACMQMSAISFVACKKVEKRNLSACNKGNSRSVHPGNIEVAKVGKIPHIKHNCITTTYPILLGISQLRNNFFIESFHDKVIYIIHSV